MARTVSLLAALNAEEVRDFLPDPLLAQVRTLADPFRTWDPTQRTAADFHAALAEANPEVLIAGWKTPQLPAKLPPNLKYVCYLCGSVRKLVTKEHVDQGLLVTNWGGSISRVVAEWALFHILSCLRRATYWTIAMHLEGAWKNGGTETASLYGRRIGLHGFGQIARELVKLLRPFGVSIRSYAPDITPEIEHEYCIKKMDTLEELFRDNDVVVELAPLNEHTEGIVQEKHLRLLKPGGVFVNVGRGAVVDETALLKVAQEGKIFIGLDVYTVEPLPVTSALRGLRNVTLTPHIAGPTTDRRCDAGAFAVANLIRYRDGQPLEAVITPHVYATST